MKDFGSLQGPLKEQISNLAQKLSEAESDLDVADRLIRKKDSVIERLTNLNKGMEKENNNLKVELDVIKIKSEADSKELQGLVDQLT